MRIYLDQIGCRLNYSEMETTAFRLRAAGHRVVDRAEDAHVIIFNSCAVTADAVRGSRKQARHLHAAGPTARIVLTGCWASLHAEEAAALPGVALVARNEEKDLLPLLLEPWSADFDDPALLAHLHPDSPPHTFDAPARRSRTRTFLKVQDGCNNRCTFCVVTLARGASRSRPLRELVAEAQQAEAQGIREIVLTGVHLGSYGRDLAGTERSDLKQLAAALLAETAIPRVRLSSLEPWELADGFFDLWQRWPDRLCPHLHLPLQAGTDRQLRAMARRCTTDSFRLLVQQARAAIPNLVLTTDLITGFPGESDGDFDAGLEFVAEMHFADAHIFPYSPRAGTAAATFAGEPPGDVKRARARRLAALIEQTGTIERGRFVQQSRPVLWEGSGRPLADEPGLLWSGHTDNYLRVQTVAAPDMDLHNVITPTRLSALEGTVFRGELVTD